MLIGIPWELAAVDPTSHMLLPRTLGESLNQATVSPVSLKNRVVSKAFHGQSYLISPQLLLFHSSFHLPSLNSFSKHSPLCGGGKDIFSPCVLLCRLYSGDHATAYYSPSDCMCRSFAPWCATIKPGILQLTTVSHFIWTRKQWLSDWNKPGS